MHAASLILSAAAMLALQPQTTMLPTPLMAASLMQTSIIGPGAQLPSICFTAFSTSSRCGPLRAAVPEGLGRSQKDASAESIGSLSGREIASSSALTDSDAHKLTTLDRADQMHAEKRFVDLFDLVAPLARREPDNEELAWRSARAHHDLAGDLPRDDSRREQLIRDGLAIAESALARNAESGLCHKWVGILLGSLGEFLSSKEKIANAFRIKQSLEKAAVLRPDDSSVQLALGEWAFKVAAISWVERNAAKVLFGTPPESTYEEALAFFETSARLKPNKKAMYKAALACEKLNRKGQAQQWLRDALDLPSSGGADAETDRLCSAMLR